MGRGTRNRAATANASVLICFGGGLSAHWFESAPPRIFSLLACNFHCQGMRRDDRRRHRERSRGRTRPDQGAEEFGGVQGGAAGPRRPRPHPRRGREVL